MDWGKHDLAAVGGELAMSGVDEKGEPQKDTEKYGGGEGEENAKLRGAVSGGATATRRSAEGVDARAATADSRGG